MTPLKTGAIALTLIIIIPIMLGYAMATEDVEETVDVTSDGGYLTDVILNSTTPYYIPYTGANNNGEIYRVTDDSVSLETPDYVSTSETLYSFTPIYAEETNTITLDATSYSISYTSSDGGSLGIGDGNNTPAVGLPDFLTAKMTIVYGMGGSILPMSIHIAGVGYATITMYAGDVVYITSHQTDGSTYYRLYSTRFSSDYDFSGEYVVDYIYIPLGSVNFEYVDEYTTLSIPYDPWSATISDYLAFEIVSDGATFTHSFIDSVGMLYSNETMTLSNDSQGNIEYPDVTQISIALMPGVTTLTYENSGTEVSTYADITDGWRIPSGSGTYTDYWFNGYTNFGIRGMVHIAAGESLSIGSLDLVSTSGTVTATYDGESETLGYYTDLMFELGVYDAESRYSRMVVTGIAEWPSFGQLPSESYNSVVFDSSSISAFTLLEISGDDTVEIRVDSADIVGGYFPSTKNYTLYPYSLFPNDAHQSVTIDSVGIYGDRFVISGLTYYLSDDNTITVTDLDTSTTAEVKVLGMTVEFEESNGAYSTYVDGHLIVEESSTPSRLTFGGEWSLTLHRNVITEETVTSTQWQAGEFAFTQDDFILCMILSTVLVFVGLGLMRGVKIGVLAVVCGAAGIIAFMIA